MREKLPLFLLLLFGLAALPSAAQNQPYASIDPTQYQSFVGNWTPANKPLCTAIGSSAQWNRIFHPAPVMGGNRPFSPPASFWAQHAVLLVARVINAGNTSNALRLNGLTRNENIVELSYTFTPTPSSTSTIKWWMAVAVARPLPATVQFRENGRLVCDLNIARGQWASPSPSP